MVTPTMDDLIKAFPELARRTGVQWTYRSGKVESSTDTSALILFDGDIVAVACVLTSGALFKGTRVWAACNEVLGNYVVSARKLGAIYDATFYADADLTPIPNSEAAAVAGATATAGGAGGVSGTFVAVFTPACEYRVTGIFDMNQTLVGTTVLAGALGLDVFDLGVLDNHLAIRAVAAAGERGTHSQQWEGTLTEGRHTFQLYGFRTAASGTQAYKATHTSMRLELLA